MDVTALTAAFVIATVLSAFWLWAVTRWSASATPFVDLFLTAGLCAGLALLPGMGLVLAAIFMALLTTRVSGTDTWPAVVMVVGSAVIWLAAKVLLLGWL